MSTNGERFRGSYGGKASNSLSVEELNEYKRDVPPSATTRRLYNPHKDPIVMVSKTKKNAEADDFIPARRANAPGRKLFNPYDDKSFEREDLSRVNIKRNDTVAQVSARSGSLNNNHAPTKNVNGSRNINPDQSDGKRKDDSNSEILAENIKSLSKKIQLMEKSIVESSEKFTNKFADGSPTSCKEFYDEQYWHEKTNAHLR